MTIDVGNSQAIILCPYKLPEVVKEGVKKEIEKLEELGIIVRSCSAWSSPVVSVKKHDGSIWLCGDYRKVNAVTRADTYYMPTLDEVVQAVGSSKVFSKLDLTKGYTWFRLIKNTGRRQHLLVTMANFNLFEFHLVYVMHLLCFNV